MALLARLATVAAGGSYLHWDELRRRQPPEGLSHELWWLAQKLSRRPAPSLPLVGKDGPAFWFCQPPLLLQGLHEIDRTAGASVLAPEAVTHGATRDRYLLSSLMEEAITSAQMEGAGTTRDVARDMILNNFRTMQRIREIKGQPLTPEMVLDLHRLVCEDTLAEPAEAGRLRQPELEVVVEDAYGTVAHVPPPARELEKRLEQQAALPLCQRRDTGAVHPPGASGDHCALLAG